MQKIIKYVKTLSPRIQYNMNTYILIHDWSRAIHQRSASEVNPAVIAELALGLLVSSDLGK